MAEEKEGGFKLMLSADDVRAALQQTLVQVLKPAERDRLVSTAIQKLLEGSFMRTSEIDRVFNQAVHDVARELAKTEFSKPENIEKLRAVICEAWEKRFAGEAREKLVDRVGDVFANGIFGRD